MRLATTTEGWSAALFSPAVSSGEVDVVGQALLSSTPQEGEEVAGLGLMGAAAEKEDNAGVRFGCGRERGKMAAVAGDQDSPGGQGVRPDLRIGRVRGRTLRNSTPS